MKKNSNYKVGDEILVRFGTRTIKGKVERIQVIANAVYPNIRYYLTIHKNIPARITKFILHPISTKLVIQGKYHEVNYEKRL